MPPRTFRGINYDTGTDYIRGWTSRPDWSRSVMDDELGMIRDELHANAITVFGSDPDRLLDCAHAALQLGLHVWVQPRRCDATAQEVLETLDVVASAADQVRTDVDVERAARLRLNVGCELSIFTHGLMLGTGYARRARNLRWSWPLLPVVNRRLDRLLRRAAATARQRFGGEITYGAGSWEQVDWTRFDAVGLNHYRDAANRSAYVATLADARTHDKPVLVTEFGCCSFPGAADLGAAGDEVIDWSQPDRPVVRDGHRRDEEAQAREIAALLEIFAEAGVDGTFVFEFCEPSHPRSSDPTLDIDIASFGVVAIERDEATDTYRRVPKAAFHEIARRYGAR